MFSNVSESCANMRDPTKEQHGEFWAEKKARGASSVGGTTMGKLFIDSFVILEY